MSRRSVLRDPPGAGLRHGGDGVADRGNQSQLGRPAVCGSTAFSRGLKASACSADQTPGIDVSRKMARRLSKCRMSEVGCRISDVGSGMSDVRRFGGKLAGLHHPPSAIGLVPWSRSSAPWSRPAAPGSGASAPWRGWSTPGSSSSAPRSRSSAPGVARPFQGVAHPLRGVARPFLGVDRPFPGGDDPFPWPKCRLGGQNRVFQGVEAVDRLTGGEKKERNNFPKRLFSERWAVMLRERGRAGNTGVVRNPSSHSVDAPTLKGVGAEGD